MTSDHDQPGRAPGQAAPGQAAPGPSGGEQAGGDGTLRVASVNWLTGGLDRATGSTRRQRTIVEAVAPRHPHIVLGCSSSEGTSGQEFCRLTSP